MTVAPISTYVNSLRTVVRGSLTNHILTEMCLHVIENPLFQVKPGSSSHHHNYPIGLLEHTYEVVTHCLDMAGMQVDMDVLITAAVWHDFHKIYEYDWNSREEKVQVLPYRNYVGHIVGSVIEFLREGTSRGLSQDLMQKITHCMLAHHGRCEWRSPVEPQTREAWILHAADMLSARGNH